MLAFATVLVVLWLEILIRGTVAGLKGYESEISTEFGSHSERDRRQYCSYKLTTPLLALEYIIITQLLTSLTALHLGVAERVLLRNIRYFLDNIYVKKEIEVKKLFYA